MVELTEQSSSSSDEESDSQYDQRQQQQQQHHAQPASSSATGGGGNASSPAFTNDFQQLLQLASHLKSSQPEVREKRQKWEQLKFLQKNTVITQKMDALLRYAPVDPQAVADRLATAQLWKTAAAGQFKKGEYQRASLEYQRTIGLFQWARKFQTKDGDEINWYDVIPVNKPTTAASTAAASASGLDESALITAAASEAPIDFVATPLPSPAREQAQQIVFTCLVNIAACEEKLAEWHQVIDAAELALAMPISSSQSSSSSSADSPNLTALRVKALYRAAMAYNKLDELEKAIAYLQRAVKLAPKDAAIAQELANLKQAAVEQSQKDQKNYGGLFDRGAIFNEEDPASSFDNSKDTKDQQAKRAPKVDASGALPVEAADQTKQFMQDYLSGFSKLQNQEKSKSKSATPSSQLKQRASTIDDDDDIDGEIDTQASRRANRQSSSVPESLAAMYADAKANFGIDLSDPMVQEELRRMQEEHMRTGKPVNNPKENANSSSSGNNKAKSQTDVPSDLGGGSWIGPVVFCIIFAILLRWMKIV